MSSIVSSSQASRGQINKKYLRGAVKEAKKENVNLKWERSENTWGDDETRSAARNC
jgi:hypothetical protein